VKLRREKSGGLLGWSKFSLPFSCPHGTQFRLYLHILGCYWISNTKVVINKDQSGYEYETEACYGCLTSAPTQCTIWVTHTLPNTRSDPSQG